MLNGQIEIDRLKNEMSSKFHGAQTARLPLLLEEDLEWKELSVSPKDMDWIEGLRFSALQIAQIYNVPPELIGLAPATHQNRKEARKARRCARSAAMACSRAVPKTRAGRANVVKRLTRAMLIPTSFPFRSRSAPPRSPGSIGVSCWMTSGKSTFLREVLPFR